MLVYNDLISEVLSRVVLVEQCLSNLLLKWKVSIACY